MTGRWTFALIALLISCGEPAAPVEQVPEPRVQEAATVAPTQIVPTRAAPTQTPTQVIPTPIPTPTALPTPPPTPTPSPQFVFTEDIVYRTVEIPRPRLNEALRDKMEALEGMYGSALPWRGLNSLEETILGADVIARVSLVSTSTSWSKRPQIDRWGALLEFRFRVHEYLKGSGPDEIGSIAYMGYSSGEEYARAGMAMIAEAHDSRWDDREAIVFLKAGDWFEHWWPPYPSASDQYFFGEIALSRPEFRGVPHDAYTVGSPYRKLWLPEASAPAGSSSGRGAGSSTEQVFLLDAPADTTGNSGGARGATTMTAPTISLSNMKSKVAALEAEANAGGTPEYRACVEGAYIGWRITTHLVRTEGTPLEHHDVSIASGRPAGTPIIETYAIGTTTLDVVPRYWYDGADKEIVRPEVIGARPGWALTPPGEELLVVGHVTKRPLPAGGYTFFYNEANPACSLRLPNTYNHHRVDLTVTAPPRTLHEAFFDPVDIGTAVGADTSNGVLEPSAFSLDGATTTISSLKWQDGAVTMTLNPTASLADYAIDFIDINGTTTLSLTSDNASTTALTWNVPDKPWADGDLLMLRIHKPISTDATLSALTLSGVALTFDPATTTYAASVPATTTQTTVTPTTNHGSATYVVKLAGVTDLDGTIPLAAGNNVITVDVTAEDAVTTQTYTVTITRATPAEPVTVTLTPRTEGLTFFDLTVQWNDTQTCDNRYFVTVRRNDGYIVRNMGFHPAETSSVTLVTYWPMDNVPDFVAVVECDPSSGPRREVGRMSLRSARN